MTTKSPNGARRDRHRPGYYSEYRKQERAGKRGLVLLLTDTEFEAVSRRAKKDGLTKQQAARMSLLHYAKHGLNNG
jgi:hypothetical protein